jgi:hypothetical protein
MTASDWGLLVALLAYVAILARALCLADSPEQAADGGGAVVGRGER